MTGPRLPGLSPRAGSCLIVLLMSAVTLAIYWQVGDHPFVLLDDNDYVTGNFQVRGGLTQDGVAWSFGTFHANNWHPLTWMSHMLDVTLFGLDAGWHHRVNVLFHAVNAILLFLVLEAMTGATWRSAFVAALFAVHPLHVESVAWVSERKDVLSAFFWFLSIGAYVRYARNPGWKRYLGIVCSFSLGLLCKPMLVTLPFVLLLLDYWPLGRMAGRGTSPSSVPIPPVPLRHLVLEKVPLVLLSVASSVVTLIAQGKGGAIATLESVPAGYRAANALVSYLRYLGMAGWPSSLAVYYPLSLQDLHAWKVIGSGCALAGISAAAVLWRKRHPWLIVGWLWYLGTLVPVIGLAQVGSQSMADRYTYVPLTGIFIIAAWGGHELLRGWSFRRQVLGVLGALALAALSTAAWAQAGYWRDNITLFRRALEVTERNWFAWNNLGVSHWVLGHHPEAIAGYRESLRINPHYAVARRNLAEALKVTEGIAAMWNDTGVAYSRRGRYPEAIVSYEKALRVRPDYADAWRNLAVAYEAVGEHSRAAEAFSAAMRNRR